MFAITMGDASGVGPEIILKAYASGEVASDFVVVGDGEAITACAETLGLRVPIRRVESPEDCAPGSLNLIDLGLLRREDLTPGRISRAAGAAAAAYLETAVKLALEKRVKAVVTLPMNKEATRLSHPDFTGHTEHIAVMCGQSDYTMMLASDKLMVTHVSTHVSLSDAILAVTSERVETVIGLTHDALARFNPAPRIAVAGLNPHAGEHGSFGTEDQRMIKPAVEAARSRGWQVWGPEPPDTVFFRAVRGDFDAVVCMYHDQGHIPMKLLDFEGGVNVTLGLSVVRTSVDHGTAFDIAWKGRASTRSYVLACDYARRLTAS